MQRLTQFKLWLATRWVVAAGFMAAVMLALVPVLESAFALPLLLIFLHNPGYMIHQVEEHTGDRFRRFANVVMFGGREGLTTASVLVVNVGAVWTLNLGALYAAAFAGPGYGLIAPYAMVVNAVTHIGAAARLRRYNPGLVTAILLFLPLALVTITVIGREPEVSLAEHAAGLGGALILHAVIIASVALRLRRLDR
ncbi:HXXEE domain-containing protein [Ancylobacter radicis]|uniref:HXXEE domain-containing protein n=1 Tax=Ancylobacter radicis TaxID=2836179 RepID=A0ABS5R8P3_9HYPH|nr:HXXEE domain-containing protein [Ancylobacter radicis]MBS9478041.1 HXXEE domain-containing protein [Ancylobacter radicis]